MRREFNKKFLSLLHFDFPYFAENGDGCRDEIGRINWERAGGVKFCGSEIPYDEEFAPKFGYRCMKTTDSTTYLLGTGGTEIFNINSAKNFIVEAFIYPINDGNILALYSGSSALFTLKIASGKLQVICGVENITSTNNLTLNQWQHIAVKISGNRAALFINGTQDGEDSFICELENISSARLGGFNGYIDEFLFSTKSSVIVPEESYKGTLDINTMGGTGDSKHGAANYTAANSNLVINTCASIKTITSPQIFTYENLKTNTHGDFAAGDEILLITRTGLYSFRHVKTISGNTITLDSPVTEFDFNLNASGSINIIKVPNYSSFTLGQNVILKPCQNFGLVVFRVKNNCTINGKILTHGTYIAREDLLQMTHSDLPERFLMNTNGGVIIICGGTFSASSNARIGGDYSGDNKGGVGARKSNGTNGGAGYGGGGSSCKSQHTSHTGGTGGVGGGGGAGDNGKGGQAGTNNNTGGYGVTDAKKIILGGTQGKTTGAAGNIDTVSDPDSGGGGALGNAGGASLTTGGLAGANILIVCKKFSCDLAAISTGGMGGISTNGKTYGGGGSGLCYIACQEMI